MRVEGCYKEGVSSEAASAQAGAGYLRSECGHIRRTGGRSGYIVDVFSSQTLCALLVSSKSYAVSVNHHSFHDANGHIRTWEVVLCER